MNGTVLGCLGGYSGRAWCRWGEKVGRQRMTFFGRESLLVGRQARASGEEATTGGVQLEAGDRGLGAYDSSAVRRIAARTRPRRCAAPSDPFALTLVLLSAGSGSTTCTPASRRGGRGAG